MTYFLKVKLKKYFALLKPIVTIYGYFEAVNEKLDVEKQFKELLKKTKLEEKFENFDYARNKFGKSEEKLNLFFDLINQSWKIKLFNQVPSSYCLFIKSNYPEIFQDQVIIYRGTSKEDVLKR